MDDLKGLSAKLHCIDAAFDGQVFIAPSLIFIFHRTTHLHINCFASFRTGQKIVTQYRNVISHYILYHLKSN